jgi:hypothetical protein
VKGGSGGLPRPADVRQIVRHRHCHFFEGEALASGGAWAPVTVLQVVRRGLTGGGDRW